jgi:hypothetical protein
MMEWLAQTTQPSLPEGWANLIYALTGLITAIGGLLVVIWRRQGKLTDRQEVTENNTKSLAGATLANTRAINQSPGPNVPASAEIAAMSISEDPTAPALPVTKVDPVDPQPKV